MFTPAETDAVALAIVARIKTLNVVAENGADTDIRTAAFIEAGRLERALAALNACPESGWYSPR